MWVCVAMVAEVRVHGADQNVRISVFLVFMNEVKRDRPNLVNEFDWIFMVYVHFG